MAAGIARLIEICFIVSQIEQIPQGTPDGSITTVVSPFQHLPPFVSNRVIYCGSSNSSCHAISASNRRWVGSNKFAIDDH